MIIHYSTGARLADSMGGLARCISAVFGIFLLVLASALIFPNRALAQQDEFQWGKNQPIPQADERRLRAFLAAPVPTGASKTYLGRHFDEKLNAADALGYLQQTEKTLRAAIANQPDRLYLSLLAALLAMTGDLEEAYVISGLDDGTP